MAVLTGAGCSTESGIPDYRGPETARRARNPIQYNAFIGDPEGRRRYWARSLVGWPRIEAATPNPAHRAIAALEQAGLVTGVITQNVDGLHQKAGSRQVIELHGALAQVVCLDCGRVDSRAEQQHRMLQANPGWSERRAEAAPDGDAELSDVAGFVVPGCVACGGALKPNVVFFGENVSPAVVEASYATVASAEALLVVGTSLTVFSGYRFVRRASDLGLPIAMINMGPTRGDPLVTARLDARAGEVLPALVDALKEASHV